MTLYIYVNAGYAILLQSDALWDMRLVICGILHNRSINSEA